MKILITGATGFIGKSLIKKLPKKSFKIIALSRKNYRNESNIKYIQDTIRLNKKLNIVKKFEPEVLIHLSWEGIPNFSKSVLKKNIKDQKIFFKKISLFKNLKKIIVAGSCLEYQNKIGKCEENNRLTNLNDLGKTKNELFKFIKDTLNDKIKLYWLRIFYIYGQNQRKGSLIPLLLDSAKKKKPIKLKNVFNSHDYIHVDDVSSVIKKLLLKNLKSDVYNVGYGRSISIVSIIRILEKLLKKKITFRSYEKSKQYSFYSCNRKLRKNLGFIPKISLEKGLKELIKTNK